MSPDLGEFADETEGQIFEDPTDGTPPRMDVPSARYGHTDVFLRKGRIIFPGQGMVENRPEPEWFSGGLRIPLTEMRDGHLLNAIKKLNEGRLGRDHRGKSHPQWPNLLEEAARRGLCLQRRPEISGLRSALGALRRTIMGGTPPRVIMDRDNEPRRRAILRDVDMRTDPPTVRDDVIEEAGVVERGIPRREEPVADPLADGYHVADPNEDDFRFDDGMDEARDMAQEMQRERDEEPEDPNIRWE